MPRLRGPSATQLLSPPQFSLMYFAISINPGSSSSRLFGCTVSQGGRFGGLRSYLFLKIFKANVCS